MKRGMTACRSAGAVSPNPTFFSTVTNPTMSHRTSVRLRAALITAALGSASAAQAYEFNALDQLASQAEFRQLSEDLSATLAFKPQAPAEGLGLTGFDLGVSLGGTSVKSHKIVERATGSDNVPSTLPTVTLRAEKGLPFGVDVGAAYTLIPGTSVRAVSGNVKWAFIEGGVLTPAVAVRGFYTQTSGLGDMSLRSQGVDLSVSKGFANVTPYGGVGLVQSRASDDTGRWARERYTQTRLFAGVNVSLLLVNLAFEADRTGDATSASIRAGLRF